MNRRFEIKKRHGNRNYIFLTLMTGLIVVLLFVYSSQLLSIIEYFDTDYKNVNIIVFDHTIQKENPYTKVIINGQLVYQIDSISKSLYQETQIKLKKGKHIIEISTIDNKFKLIDTIKVVHYPMKYNLWIDFNYNPPIDEYRMILIDHIYQKNIKGKDFTAQQKSDVLSQVEKKINKEFENEVNYQPSEPYFTYIFEDNNYYRIQ